MIVSTEYKLLSLMSPYRIFKEIFFSVRSKVLRGMLIFVSLCFMNSEYFIEHVRCY